MESAITSSAIRILLIDDHELFLAGVQALLKDEAGLVVVGAARNRKEALEAARAKPHIILLDLNLGSESGLDFLPDLLKSAEGTRILVVTGECDSELHLRAVCLGALGVLLKIETPQVLVKAIRKIHAGEAWMNRRMMARAMSKMQARDSVEEDPNDVRIASLTARERQVITSLGEGRRNKEIAQRLFISEKTVRHYLTSIFSKLEVTDRLELMIFAYKHGLATVPSRQTTVAY